MTVPSASSYTVHARRGYAVDARSPDATATTPGPRRRSGRPMRTRVPRSACSSTRTGAATSPPRGRRSARPPIARRSSATSAPAAIPGPAILDAKPCSRSSSRKPASWRIATMRGWRRAICWSPTRSSSGSRSRPTSSSATGSGQKSRMLEGVLQPGATEGVVANALKRFPDEPRFLLARAVAADQRASFTPTSPTGRAVTCPGDRCRRRVRRRDRAAGDGRRGAPPQSVVPAPARPEHERAAVARRRAGRSPEAGLRYLRELFRGTHPDRRSANPTRRSRPIARRTRSFPTPSRRTSR